MRLLNSITLLSIFLVSGCSTEHHEWTEFPAYDKAIDIDNYVFPNGIANQIFYKVKAQYPNTDVLKYYKSIVKKSWIECTEKNEWESFGDVSGNEPLFIHQTVQRWVNRDKSRLLLLAIKYRSQGVESRETPDNNIQNVYLVEYYEPDIEKTLSALEVSCNGV